MKFKNLKIKLPVLLILAVLVSGCNEYNPGDPNPVPDDNTSKPVTGQMRSFLTKRSPETQTFTKDASNYIYITSKNGYIYTFPKGVLRDAQGNVVEGKVDVEITEVTSNSDMIYSGVTTTSGDQILQSGGMFKIDISQNGQKLKVNGNYGVILPTSNVQSDMRIFQGKESITESGDTIVDWEESDSSTWSSDTTGRRYHLNLNFLSWCNLDRYYNASNGAQVRVKLPDGFTNKNSTAYMIYNVRSVVYLFVDAQNQEFNSMNYNIPLGWNIKLLVVASKDDQLYYGLRNSTVVQDHLEKFDDLTKVSEAELEDIIDKLD